MEKRLSEQELFRKIKEEGINPRPKWVFDARNYLIWASIVVFILLEGMAVSVIVYILRYSEWGVYRQATDSWGEFFLLFLPVFWLVVTAAAIFIVFYNLRHTKKGYRYPAYVFITTTIFLGAVLGGAFFYAGLGGFIDNVLGKQAPYYDKIINPRVSFWCQPQEGRLIGVVSSSVDDRSFVLYGCDGVDWSVRIQEGVKIRGHGQHMGGAGHFYLPDSGDPIRAIGDRVSENGFVAHEIMPVRSGRMFLEHHWDSHPLPSSCRDCPVR